MTTNRDNITHGAAPVVEHPFCDDCLTAALDLGAETLYDQQMVCMEIGADIRDHLCIETEEPDLNIKCRCACRRRNNT